MGEQLFIRHLSRRCQKNAIAVADHSQFCHSQVDVEQAYVPKLGDPLVWQNARLAFDVVLLKIAGQPLAKFEWQRVRPSPAFLKIQHTLVAAKACFEPSKQEQVLRHLRIIVIDHQRA